MNTSIVMPLYLREESHKDLVIQTLESIRDGGGEYELILVDDGSPLDTEFTKELIDVHIRHPKNSGISAAWNTGMRASKGEYVVIVNDDIKVPSGWLKKLKQGFGTPMTGVTAPKRGGPHVEPKIEDEMAFANHKFYPGYCFMLKKDVFFKPFDEQFRTNCGDTDYWHRIREAGFKCVRVGLNVWHKEGGVLHGMDYGTISKESIKLFEDKWGFNPQKKYYG